MKQLPSPIFISGAADEREQRVWFGHPRGLTILFLTGMWEVFALIGMRALLVYYIVQELALGQQAAIQIYSISSAGALMMGIVGGLLADRALGLTRAVTIGAALMALGFFALSQAALLIPALIAVAIGNGLLKPTLVAQVGLMYDVGDPRRDRGFTIYKVGTNSGAIAAPIICGAVAQVWGWDAAFAICGLGMLVSLLIYMAGRTLLPASSDRRESAVQSAGPALLSGPHRLALLGAIWLSSLFFWNAYNHLGGAVALWAENGVDRTIALGGEQFVVPPSWFQSVNPLLIVLLVPVVNFLWARTADDTGVRADIRKMGQGTLLAALCYAILAIASAAGETGAKPGMCWLIAAIVPLTLAEIYVDPVGQSVFTRLAGPKMTAVFVAVWFLGYMTGYLTASALAPLWLKSSATHYFTALTTGTLLGVVAFALLVRYSKRATTRT